LRDVSAAGLQPTLGSSASVQRSRSGINGNASSTSNLYQAGLDAAWEIDIFGANRSALAAAEAAARASAASLGDVQVSVAAEAALGYIALRGAQAQMATATNNLASQMQTLQITEWRAQAGLLSALEAEQARAAAAQTQALLPALQTTVQQAAHALAVLTGRPPAALAALVAAPAAVPQPAGSLALSLPADTLRQRADVRAAEQQVLAAQSRVAQADAARWPRFNLGGSLGLSALTFSALGNGAAVAGSLLASVSLPLWDGGAARAQVRAQQAALDLSRASYRGTVLLALQDVEDALVALRNDRLRATSLQGAATAATNAATLARQRYGSGLVDFQTVLETQRSQFSAQDGLASITASLSADHVRLYKALGGGWQPDAEGAPALSTGTRPR
jgi:NodT family efflux transporter outer membrane factor (OMF) lipoprotein